ncbi:penicillin-insensitive murein endopeptidase [Kaarinaea lacus]
MLYVKLIIALVTVAFTTSVYPASSICFGSPSNGRLEGGVSLPKSGANFQSYSTLGHLLRRTYVHREVKDIIIATYRELEQQAPGKQFVYGETGWPSGGSFKPHKTHQNGLAVDFMVPVVDKTGTSIALPTNVTNKYGYDIEFDDKGQRSDYDIDYEAMATHLMLLHQQSVKNGYNIKLVVFDPQLQSYLFKSSSGNYLKTKLKFTSKRAWVRHDDHYHVIFDVPCEPM